MQVCVQIELIFVLAFCCITQEYGTDSHTKIKILLSVKEHTYSSCVYVLYDEEKGRLFDTSHDKVISINLWIYN
jgi:hypothetical protein